MSVSTTVAGVALPLAAATISDATNDPTIDLMLAYVGHWLREMLDARLAVQVPTSSNACPPTQRHPWDPRDVWAAMAKPALFIWQHGASRITHETSVYDRRERTLGLFYVFDEMHLPSGLTPRAGLMSTADAILARAFDRMSHPTFSYGSYAAGRNIRAMLDGDLSSLAVRYDGGEVGFMAEIPGESARQGMSADGRVQRGFPCLRGTLTVWERVGLDTSSYETDAAGDVDVTIRTNTESIDPVDVVTVLECYLPSFDGEGD